MTDENKSIDEEWKKSAQEEKERLRGKQEVNDAIRVEKKDKIEYPQEVNFITFLSGLVAQGLVALGQIENPFTNKKEVDLKQAQFIIDTITMLEEKTKGNLTKEEEKILADFIRQLQFLFIKVNEGK